MRLEARSENGCGKWPFFGLKEGQDLGNRAAHPKNSQEKPQSPLPPPPLLPIPVYKFALSNLFGMH